MENIEKEDVVVWLSNPCTKEVIAQLYEERQYILEQWAQGQFTGESSEATAQLNAEMLGRIKAIDMHLSLYQEIKESQQESNYDGS